MVIEGFFGCFRIIVVKIVSILLRSEVIIFGKVCVLIGLYILFCESIVELVDYIVGK